MRGDYPGNARKRRATMTVEPLDAEIVVSELVETNGDGAADPGAIRPALAQLAASNLDALQRSLLDAALSATTTRWATVTCGDCGARSRVELPVPDTRARLQAIETLLAQGLGRPGQADEPPVPRLPHSIAAVTQMGWEEMQHVFAATYADDITTAEEHGGAALVREKIAALSVRQRQALRDALDELELV